MFSGVWVELYGICRHNAGMVVKITIRDVPEEMRDELASRASEQGQSLQKYLMGELERILSRPSSAEWLKRVEARKRASGVRIPVSVILEAKDADKR